MKRNQLKLWLRMKGKVQPKKKKKKKGKEDHGYEFILRLKLQDYKCLPLTAIAWKEKK